MRGSKHFRGSSEACASKKEAGDGRIEHVDFPTSYLIVLVVEEDAAKATGFAAVLDGEVLVGPLLELSVVLGVVLVADLEGCESRASERWGVRVGARRGIRTELTSCAGVSVDMAFWRKRRYEGMSACRCERSETKRWLYHIQRTSL